GAGSRVARAVGQRFLDHPVDRHLGDRGQLPHRADRAELDRLTEPARGFDEFGQIAEAGVALSRGVCAGRTVRLGRTVGIGRSVSVWRGDRVAGGVDEGAELVDGLTGRGLDDLPRFLGLVGIPLEAATRGGGVDADSGDVVGDAVVELTGYAHAFE